VRGFRKLEARVSQVVHRHLGDTTIYVFKNGGSVETRVQVYEKPAVLKDDSVRGLAAATSRQINAAETVMMASLLSADVPAPKRGDTFTDEGVQYMVEHIIERTPSRFEVSIVRV
jgi:hypothetical protein